MGTEMEQKAKAQGRKEVERRGIQRTDTLGGGDKDLKSGSSDQGSLSLVGGLPWRVSAPPPVLAWARVGLGDVLLSYPPSAPSPDPGPVDSPPPGRSPQARGRGAPPGRRPTSLGLSCGGGAAAGPLSPTLSPGAAAAHNCE